MPARIAVASGKRIHKFWYVVNFVGQKSKAILTLLAVLFACYICVFSVCCFW